MITVDLWRCDCGCEDYGVIRVLVDGQPVDFIEHKHDVYLNCEESCPSCEIGEVSLQEDNRFWCLNCDHKWKKENTDVSTA